MPVYQSPPTEVIIRFSAPSCYLVIGNSPRTGPDHDARRIIHRPTGAAVAFEPGATLAPEPEHSKRQLSEKQLEVNRRNALKSTGPRTDAGRNRARLNACRHNLTGQTTVMTVEDRAPLETFTAAMMTELAPVGMIERQLAERIASNNWRLNRASSIEHNLFADGLASADFNEGESHDDVEDTLTQSRVYSTQAKNLQLLTLYEQRLNRAIEKNMNMLRSLQAERQAKRAAEMEEAMKLLQVSEIKGIEYQPAKDGFVFSKLDIYVAIQRARRLARAAKTDFSAFNIRQFLQKPAAAAAPPSAQAA